MCHIPEGGACPDHGPLSTSLQLVDAPDTGVSLVRLRQRLLVLAVGWKVVRASMRCIMTAARASATFSFAHFPAAWLSARPALEAPSAF